MSVAVDGLEVEISSSCMEFKKKFILEKHSLYHNTDANGEEEESKEGIIRLVSD